MLAELKCFSSSFVAIQTLSYRSSAELFSRRTIFSTHYFFYALLAAGKRPGKDVAVTLNRVPADLDAAHVGFVFADVMGSDPRQELLCATGRRPSQSDGGRIRRSSSSCPSQNRCWCACRRHKCCQLEEWRP